VRATLLSAGTSIFFRASPEDAPYISRALDGGHSVERLVKELPNRHFLVRSGAKHWSEVVAPELRRMKVATGELEARSNARWAKPRSAIEDEISGRRTGGEGKEELAQWV
jgi:hypothetical protein